MSLGTSISAASMLAAVAIAASIAIGGPSAGAGMGLGIAFTSFSLVATWILIKAVSPAAGQKSTPGILVGLLFLFKLPLLAVCAIVVVKMGLPALFAFLTGIVLVYCALIWKVQTLPRPTDPRR